VLICSTDPAPSLGDLFEQNVGPIPKPVLHDKQFQAVEVDSTGHVWFSEFDGTRNDLVELDPATGKMTSYKIPTGPALVRKLTVDAKNTVWYANNGRGKIGKVLR